MMSESNSIEQIVADNAPQALGAYSQAVKAKGFVFVSGQLGIDPQTGKLAGDTAEEQARQALKNVSNILQAAGSSVEKVVKATIYMHDVEDFTKIDAEYAAVFKTSPQPARAAFGGNNLPKGALVEIEAIAVQ